MADTTPNSTERIEARLDRAEAQLRRVKIVLCAIGIVMLCALIPPLGEVLGLFVAIVLILAAVLTYIFGIIRLLDRYFGDKTNHDELQQ